MGGSGSGRTRIPEDDYRIQAWFRIERKFYRMVLNIAHKYDVRVTNYMRNLVLKDLGDRKMLSKEQKAEILAEL